MIFDILITGPSGVLPTILGYRERKKNMSELNAEQKEYYIDIAEKHADFLIEKLFRPTFLIAFIHGVKHGRKDVTNEFDQLQIEEMKAELHRNLNAELNNQRPIPE